MNLPGFSLDGRRIAAVAATLLLSALMIPAAALGQAAIDQYAPTTPDGGGSVPSTPAPTPVPNADGGGSPTADTDTSGGGADADAGSSSSESTASAPDDPVASSASGSGNSANAVADKPRNEDKGTVEGIASGAEQQREAATAGSSETSPATRLLRSDDGGDGMGFVLYLLLGLTAVWAIATGITRRRQDGHPA